MILSDKVNNGLVVFINYATRLNITCNIIHDYFSTIGYNEVFICTIW